MTSITPNSQNSKSLTNKEIDASLTWDEATMTWDDATGTWNVPGKPITKSSVNNKSLSNTAQ